MSDTADEEGLSELIGVLRHALEALDARHEYMAAAHVAHAIAVLDRTDGEDTPRMH